MKLVVNPGHPLKGRIKLPGDKSISHRAALFAALAQGESRIDNFLVAGVTKAMLQALNELGVAWSLKGTTLTIQGQGLEGLITPTQTIHCGNSGTTLRLLAGALTAANISATLSGTEGLQRRPMMRIVTPLQKAGALIEASPEGTAPITLRQRAKNQSLSGESHVLPVASAQVKTSLLLAGLAANAPTTVVEPSQSRDHTERMLAAMGVQINQQMLYGKNHVTLTPPGEKTLRPLKMTIPGDISSAAFLIVAALITPGSDILIQNVGLNPTRTGIIDVLISMGANIQIINQHEKQHEPVGDIRIRHSQLHGVCVSGDQVVKMIDEFPVLAAAGAYATGDTVVKQAEELRYKESDRISSICSQFQNIGTVVEERPDGFIIKNHDVPIGGEVYPQGDHRLAMAFAVSGLGAKQTTIINNAEIFHESYPQFVDDLKDLGADIEYG